MSKYLKMAGAVLATVLAALVPILGAGNGITADQWINVAIIGVGACAVFAAPNVPGAAYTKTILAVLTAALTVLVSVISDGLTSAEIIQVALAVLGALGVVGLKNTDPKTGANLSYTDNAVTQPRDAHGRFVAFDGKDTP